ncbi:glutathione S-transferase [Altererythrobacter aerius]|uniref:Glutathione S-transferase n=1 Tax=Tsuneonella aeria TaxID=1837929 RepID=A0A6I4TEM3_9SPHN|nr:glutathione S-transferase [Tsuneonella aeria]MXO75036.1 glutathione S-transferase [Tsuneonella aeria]
MRDEARAPVLYSFRRCPYAMRARLALVISGIRCELREVSLKDKPESMLAASPKGTVPVLIAPDGAVIEESLDIMHWALGRHDPEGWLERDDPDLVARNDTAFKFDLDRYKYASRHGTDPQVHRASGLMFLRDLEARLSRTNWLCGAARGFADAAILPFVRQFAAVEPDWFKTQAMPRLSSWLAGFLASPLYAAVMTRIRPWQPGDAILVLGAEEER